MLLRKQGFPEEGEFVLCTVTAVHHNSIFVNLDEFNKTGLIHISEISPGRIRNIRDYVVEGKKIVCLVLRIDAERGHIDLSLRRVNENQKRNKINAVKQEQKAEKIVEYVAKKLNVGLTIFYKEIYDKISKKYAGLYPFFEEVALGKAKIDKLALDKAKAKALLEEITDRIKPSEVFLSSEFKLTSYAPDGVAIIKDVLDKAAADNIVIKYEGGGKYKADIKANDYKKGDKVVEKFKDNLTALMQRGKGEVVFLKQ